MNYGFVINNKSCIGCHACSTACKSENQVPLGVNRTWVKYTETGRYPDVSRNFQVTRCNHCSNPPCVRICPVTAMVQRTDGIVEFDGDQCIGCKACMQACPYDAIYIDPDSGTAAKCHFCAHRVENGVEPACVVVCPTHSIIAGDLDDPASEISRVIARNNVSVRKPEQGTAPKVFYVEGHDVSMHPTALPREPEGMLWADVVPLHGERKPAYTDQPQYDVHLDIDGSLAVAARGGGGHAPLSGHPIRAPQAQGVPTRGPIHVGEGSMAGHMVQVAYNAQHKIPWHWPVPAYLVTKGIGAGIFLLLAIGLITGLFEVPGAVMVAAGLLGLTMLGATTAFLVADLDRPERFLRIVFQPQWKSWLTRGAYILIAFSNVAGLWWLAETAAWMGWLPVDMLATIRPIAAWVTLPLALGAAIYTAFLFAQAEGRDLWQSSLLPVHLLVQSVMMGAAGLLLVVWFVDAPDALVAFARAALLGGLLADVFVTLLGEFGIAHASEVAARAAHEITHGRYARQFWWGGVGLGHVVPLALLLVGGAVPAALAALAAVAGLYFYEHAFVMAPQEVPNS